LICDRKNCERSLRAKSAQDNKRLICDEPTNIGSARRFNIAIRWPGACGLRLIHHLVDTEETRLQRKIRDYTVEPD